MFGFTEQWEVDMVRFWRDWNDATERHRVRELDIKWLVALGRTDDSFSRVDVVSAGARKLATLLPDANVPNMFQREPAIIHFNFVRASQSILELQEVLCDVDKCTDVTPVLERHPRLLLCEDVRAEVEAAKARLHELAPKCDAAKAVNEYPELSACAYPDAKSRSFAPRFRRPASRDSPPAPRPSRLAVYRIHQYDEYAELPISIQNIIMETSSEDISERIDEYNARWDDWEREAGAGEGAFGDAAGLDETSWRNDRGGFDAPDAQEWMLDGYYDEDDD